MDYDRTNIAAVYDSARGLDSDMQQLWLDLISAYMPKDGVFHIVDLGCGTGRFSEPLSVHFQADVIGIDPSETMLEQARNKVSGSSVTFKQASGDKLPVETDSADMVFMSMVFHHLPDPGRTATECHRILRDGGHVCVRNATTDAMETFGHTRFFPGIRSVMEEQLVSRDLIKSVFEGAGFNAIGHESVTHQGSPTWRDFADMIAMRAYSILTRLTDDDFQAGVAALRAHAEQADPEEPVTELVDFFVFQRQSDKAGDGS
jgi:SAM-dependent methyltransferase